MDRKTVQPENNTRDYPTWWKDRLVPPVEQSDIERPLSPRLIYHWHIGMAASFLHRITGVAIFLSIPFGLWFLIQISHGEDAFNRPFIALKCASITPTLFESELFGYEAGAFTGSSRKGQIGKMELSDGGTLFLDEIGELPLEMQPKLLKALQDREIYRVGGTRKIPLNFRLICATNCELEKRIEENRFRLDLFYRINTAKILIPTLQQRKKDIIPLARMFLEEFARSRKQPTNILTKEAAMVLSNYDWPGNVRQLQNTMEQAAFLSNADHLNADQIKSLLNKKVDTTDSSESFSINFPDQGLNLYDIEKKIVEKVLAKFEGNKTKTASYLNISINKVRRIIGDL